MVQTQLIERSLLEPGLLQAFLTVERHLFLDEKYWPMAYADAELPIGYREKINSPYTVAMLSHIITARNDQRVLEIGSGSGYQAAILSRLVKEVYTIEIIPELGRGAAERLKRLGYSNVRSKIGDGYLGWAEFAPFDGIIVTCSPDHIPQPLIDQLAVGGRMVIPISLSSKVEELILIEKRADGTLKKTNIVPPQFVPLFRGLNEF
jgi:protein-L-isoaspartate(D-aspartate) O-methyltransferase